MVPYCVTPISVNINVGQGPKKFKYWLLKAYDECVIAKHKAHLYLKEWSTNIVTLTKVEPFKSKFLYFSLSERPSL